MKPLTLKEVVLSLRELKFSQEQMAKIAKVSQGTISRWNHENPALVNMKALERLAKKLESEKQKRGIK